MLNCRFLQSFKCICILHPQIIFYLIELIALRFSGQCHIERTTTICALKCIRSGFFLYIICIVLVTHIYLSVTILGQMLQILCRECIRYCKLFRIHTTKNDCIVILRQAILCFTICPTVFSDIDRHYLGCRVIINRLFIAILELCIVGMVIKITVRFGSCIPVFIYISGQCNNNCSCLFIC